MPDFCTDLTSIDSTFPSTPTPDSSAKRLSWSKMMQKLTDLRGSNANHSIDSDSDSWSRSECSDSESVLISSFSTSGETDLFFDPVEETLCKEVVDVIAHCLMDAKDSALRCTKLLIPNQLLEHIGQELLHLSASEPCGLRGALIDLCVEQQDVCQSVEEIAVDPCLVPTFQLTLVLRLDCGGLWPRIQGLFSTKSPPAPAPRHALRLSTGFRVIKKKLYSSEELLIEEC